MNTFEGLIQIDDYGNMIYNKWIEWDHFLIPNKPKWYRDILRNLMTQLGHCLVCTILDGCYFVKGKMPNKPLHPHCDCKEKVLSTKLLKKRQIRTAL